MRNLALASLLFALPLSADSLQLRTGQILQGRIVSQDADTVVLESAGTRRVYRKAEVLRIRYGDQPLLPQPVPQPQPNTPQQGTPSGWIGLEVHTAAGKWTSAYSEYWSQYRFFMVTERGQTPRPGDFTLRSPDHGGTLREYGASLNLRTENWRAALRHAQMKSRLEYTLYQGVDAPLTAAQTFAVHPMTYAPLLRKDSRFELHRRVLPLAGGALAAGAAFRSVYQKARVIRNGISTTHDFDFGTTSSSAAWNIDNNIRHRASGPGLSALLELPLSERLSLEAQLMLYQMKGSWGLKEEDILISATLNPFGFELEGSTTIRGAFLQSGLAWTVSPDLILRAAGQMDQASIRLRNVRMSGYYSVRLSSTGTGISQLHPTQAVTDDAFLNGPLFADRLRRPEKTWSIRFSLEKRFGWR